ncbi:hypothetical protein NLU13_5841 [Sarocladium strictum]|uniref:Uncharacterized protein n=1 Tax=Sarocladium strictum TaxID=5046 RepID=A0AA39GGC7_SARSR|nr:hypothetical protein NLU13_5841 [Sarocladium strictum]
MMRTWMIPIWGILVTVVAGQVTVSLSHVPAIALKTDRAVTSATELFRQSCPEEVAKSLGYNPEVLMSSYADFGEDDSNVFPEGSVFPSSDSIVRGAVEAWAQHQNLVLRPDEIWFEILAQLNFYMTAHSEEVRHLFVTHEGKEEIQVWDFTWKDVIARFGDEIQQRVLTDWLLEWIMPGFTTSTTNDGMTATVLMMGLMQHYFSFSGGITCGIPKVTLLGVKEDWVRLAEKLDHLADWGDEPAQYAKNLAPILEMFVRTWEKSKSKSVTDFWKQIVRTHKQFSCGAGPTEYDISGWITGFLHWREDGSVRVWDAANIQPSEYTTTVGNVTYAPQALNDLPTGYAKAPLKMLDYPAPGESTQAFLLAGNIGVQRSVASEGGWATAKPMSSWFMYAPVDANATTPRTYGSAIELQDLTEDARTCQL